MKYEIIEREEKFNKNDIYCEYDVKLFEPSIDLDYKTSICICNDICIKFYLTESSFSDSVSKSLSCNEKVIVLLREELEKIYTTEENGFVLSDDFQQLAYFCDDDSELNDKINEIGIQIIKKSYFAYPFFDFGRILSLIDNKMIVRSRYGCFIKLLNKEDIELEKCDRLNKIDIEKIVYDFFVGNMDSSLFDQLFDSVKEFLIIIERKYGKINNIYEVKEEYIQAINDYVSARTFVIDTMENIITINTGYSY